MCVSLIAPGGSPGQRKRGPDPTSAGRRRLWLTNTWVRGEFPKYDEWGVAEAGLPGGHLTVLAPVF